MNLAGEFFTEINDDKCPPGLNIYYIKFATVGNRGGGGGAGNRTPFCNIVNVNIWFFSPGFFSSTEPLTKPFSTH